MPVPAPQLVPVAGKDRDWWRGAVIYQIYPRSFQDSNGDGIGDLAGITRRLPYVAELGVDAIWISPFFKSPMKDFGYDVSDYCDVDPMFGTLGDFDTLLTRAHALGLKVLIDLVLSHTSNTHPWFLQSQAGRDNSKADWPKADWYVWADAKPDGGPPNNWLSIFGGTAWQWDSQRMQYYLHNFLAEQPDLNLHNRDVQDALLDVAAFWLERGVDGFRLDTINFYFHDQKLRDNPPLPAERRSDSIAPRVNPYNWQDHLYDKSRPEMLGFLRRFRAVLDRFDGAIALGEVGDAQRGPQLQAQYTQGGDKVHMCYEFSLLSLLAPMGGRIAEVVEKTESLIGDGWMCWAFSNHDVMRHATRWKLAEFRQQEQAVRVYAALLLSLRGSICLYQGEELGLPEGEVAFDDLQDPYGIRFWPEFKGRDGCRTPFPWENDNSNGGFSNGRSWLPVMAEHLGRAVQKQSGEEDSTLAFYRRMIRFRADHAALHKGDYTPVEAHAQYLSFVRHHQGVRLFCAFNLGPQAQTIALPKGHWQPAPDPPFPIPIAQSKVIIPPWQAFFGLEQAP
ncbi:MAG: alpha glucosidase [Rhodobacteraceae bacterium]|nr:alpha glucosidase [Paracoccaceae bacterium]